MGVTAENLAKKYNISREDADGFALRSQQRWGEGFLFLGVMCHTMKHPKTSYCYFKFQHIKLENLMKKLPL